MNTDPFLSTTDLCEAFKTGSDTETLRKWYKLLQRWRGNGKLRQSYHWRYVVGSDGHSPVKVYLKSRIALLLASDTSFYAYTFRAICLTNHIDLLTISNAGKDTIVPSN